MGRLCLYYVPEPEQDRWVPGDRYWRPVLRRIVRGPAAPSGIDKVFLNLRAGLDRLGVPYVVNKPFGRLEASDAVGVLGRGRGCLAGYRQPNPIVAGVALMTHPSEWPTLCDEYPVVRYLQHSAWANEVYRPYFGERCTVWPVGIDTDAWQPGPTSRKSIDFLVYDKVRWNRERLSNELIMPVLESLRRRGLTFEVLRYGAYSGAEYAAALGRARAMIFLCEHESQGIAYQECLSTDVPILAWDPGECLDPHRFDWGQPHIPATSVPYFDGRCGLRFASAGEFDGALDAFITAQRAGCYSPRDYVLEHLTLEACAARYVEIVDAAQ